MQPLYPTSYLLDTLILASKKFHTFELIKKLANLTLATLVSLYYNIYKNKVKSAIFKNQLHQLAKSAKISADEHFVCVGLQVTTELQDYQCCTYQVYAVRRSGAQQRRLSCYQDRDTDMSQVRLYPHCNDLNMYPTHNALCP